MTVLEEVDVTCATILLKLGQDKTSQPDRVSCERLSSDPVMCANCDNSRNPVYKPPVVKYQQTLTYSVNESRIENMITSSYPLFYQQNIQIMPKPKRVRKSRKDICGNCGTTESPLWRRNSDKLVLLCNGKSLCFLILSLWTILEE